MTQSAGLVAPAPLRQCPALSEPSPSGSATPASSRRLVSLDVLRGLAILGMILSSMLPKTLPNWVDHGYQPHYRPDAAGVWKSTLVDGSPPFDPRWKAFTWVDLVFPMFLFSLGTAIPLAMSRRLDSGGSRRRAIGAVGGRAFALALFAVVLVQSTPWQLTWPHSSPDAARGRALAAFVGAFLLFVRWPRSTRSAIAIGSRVSGFAILLVLIVAGATRGAPFAWSESDVIILVLAHCYFVAATLWILTRGWGGWRLAVVAPILLLTHYLQFQSHDFADWRWLGDWPLAASPLATRLSKLLTLTTWLPAPPGGWSKTSVALLDVSPLWNVTWYKFLWCVVPGTIVGDHVLAWSQRPRSEVDHRPPRGGVLALAVLIVVVTCAGLRHYGDPTFGLGGPLATPWLAITLGLPLLIAMTILFLARSGDPAHRRLMITGAMTLAVGLLLAVWPSTASREGFFEGGISKGSPATLSYYATSVGLCELLLLGLLVTIDDRPRRSAAALLGPVEANGQNPLLCYYLAHTTLGALVTFTAFASINNAIASRLWLDTGVGVLKTLLIGGTVWALTRARVYWRA